MSRPKAADRPLPLPSAAPALAPLAGALLLAACGAGLPAACGGAPAPSVAAQARAYALALARVAEEPAAAVEACEALASPDLRADCLTAAAEALAPTDADAAAALCVDLPAGVGRDECHFQVAERSGEAARCTQAGAFADDCRLHRLSVDLGRLLPPDPAPGTFEGPLALALPAYGLDPADPRPWSAAYRQVLGQRRPLDRGRCEAAPDEARRAACRNTAVALFHDRLNHARDTGTFPCDGGPLPPALAYAPDATLDQAVAERRGRDLCP